MFSGGTAADTVHICFSLSFPNITKRLQQVTALHFTLYVCMCTVCVCICKLVHIFEGVRKRVGHLSCMVYTLCRSMIVCGCIWVRVCVASICQSDALLQSAAVSPSHVIGCHHETKTYLAN